MTRPQDTEMFHYTDKELLKTIKDSFISLEQYWLRLWETTHKDYCQDYETTKEEVKTLKENIKRHEDKVKTALAVLDERYVERKWYSIVFDRRIRCNKYEYRKYNFTEYFITFPNTIGKDTRIWHCFNCMMDDMEDELSNHSLVKKDDFDICYGDYDFSIYFQKDEIWRNG